MKYPFQIKINDDKRASQLKDKVQIGHYFVFVKDKKTNSEGRFKRLLLGKESINQVFVFPLVDEPIELDGVTITPQPRPIEPMGCLVCDRDLYRAEQDTVNLFIAFPKPPKDLQLNIDCNGIFFTKRKVLLNNGVSIERLSMLLPGQYTAQLSIAEKYIGIPVSFTVAEYTLAPLSARLLGHRLRREVEQLWFELAVESYQKPFADELFISLIDNGQEVAQIGLLPQSPGYYAGEVKIQGEGPFRLRLIAANDAERIAEVAIPGSRKVERQVTIISELGQEKCFAMMPEANALPLRGGYVTDGEFLATPLTVEKIVTEQPLIQVNANMKSVVLVILDLTTGDYDIQIVSDVSAGHTITVMNDAPMSTVFVGGFVEGQPFEGYTTFIKPIPFQLSVDIPKTIRPRTDLTMRLSCQGMENKTVPVLLSIRDERLTATDKPEVSLGSAAKRSIDTATKNIRQYPFFMMMNQLEETQHFDRENRYKKVGIFGCSHKEKKSLNTIFQLMLTSSRVETYYTLVRSSECMRVDVVLVDYDDSHALEEWRNFKTYYRGSVVFVTHKALEQQQGFYNQGIHEFYLRRPLTFSKVRNVLGTATAIKTGSVVIGEDAVMDGAVGNIIEAGALISDDAVFDEGSLSSAKQPMGLPKKFEPLKKEEPSRTDFKTAEAETLMSQISTLQSVLSNREINGQGSEKNLSTIKRLRSDFPEVLFYDLISVSGTKEVIIPFSDSLGTFTVETFALANGDWTQNQTTLVVDQPVRVDLELPLFVHPDDTVIGRFYASTSSGKARIVLTHNGKKIAFKSPQTPNFQNNNHEVDTPVELEFYVKSGLYIAKITDTVTGEKDYIEKTVGEPGKFKSYAKELGLFAQGESIDLKTTEALSLRILPTLDISFNSLVTATANYAHLCCEQTAAKILAAIFMYLTAKHDEQRNQAEQMILAGIARERKMILPGGVFALYPGGRYPNEYYSKLTVRYLWKLNQLDGIPDISENLRQAAHQGLSLADQAAKVHKMQRIPMQIQNLEDAYIIASSGQETQKVRQFIENEIDFSDTTARLKKNQHAVKNRKNLAYAAASLMALKEFKRGIKLANQVTRQFNEQGRLYSTEDSVAAIALMVELRKSGLITGETRLRVNGQEMTVKAATQWQDQVQSVNVLEGVAAIEITRLHEEDWSQFANNFPVKIEFRDTQNRKIRQFKAGVRTDLIVSLPDGYQIGDLVHIALPACLSWIQGGGKVKQFTLDFEGKNELRIPLVVTSPIEGQQHFAVCVRNMFEEERATSPGLLTIAEIAFDED